MRLRFTVLALLLTALTAGAVPAAGVAAPRHNHGLTIAASKHSIFAGDDVVVYGRLKGVSVSNQPIVLYQHLDGFRGGYVPVASTHTGSDGFYEFTENDVSSNRSWFTRGPDRAHSRTVFERVEALVSPPATSSTTVETNHPVVFTGSVTPAIHAFDRVLLQQQINGTDDWRTIDSARLDRFSNYTIVHRFRVPDDERDLRVVFPGDHRNARGESDPTPITIEQAQVSGFTITTSEPITPYGTPATISGVLSGTTTQTPIKLCSRSVEEKHFTCGTAGMTGSDGSYSFTVAPTRNELYQVRTTLPPKKHTAVLFEGVKDIVTPITAVSTTSTVGSQMTFTGTVTPDKAGHAIYLQRLGNDHDWHTVEVHVVKSDSTYQFSWTFGAPGIKAFRARIISDKRNVGAASAPTTVTVAPATPQVLPPAT